MAADAAGEGTRGRKVELVRGAGPASLLAAAALAAGALLFVPVRMPVGPMYWDLAVYIDAAQRMRMGQVPIRDFFAPVGPLAYYLYSALDGISAQAHPLLSAQWSGGLVTLPVMAAVLLSARSDAWRSWTLAAVFVLFALLPFNTRAFSPFPGADAFGIYNRHGAQLLFVVASVLLFARGRWLKPTLVAMVMLAAFWLKITAFVAAGMLCIAALVTGRIELRGATVAAGLFVAVLVVVEIASGLTSAYVADLWFLASRNGDGLASRLVQSASIWIAVLLPLGLLAVLLLVAKRDRDDGLIWLVAGTLAGLFYESQNTGSQGFIHLWPIALAFVHSGVLAGRARAIALVLVASALLPMLTAIGAAALRAHGGQIRHVAVDAAALGPFGRVSAKPETLARARAMQQHYAVHRNAYQDLASEGWLPGPDSYAEHDFQVLQLLVASAAVERLREIEADRGVRFDTVMALNFTNPYGAALGRSAPKHLSVGQDPSRTVPLPDAATVAAVAAADLVVRPVCPDTSANVELYRLYADALTQHRRFMLTPCAEAWTHPRFGDLSGVAPSESR